MQTGYACQLGAWPVPKAFEVLHVSSMLPCFEHSEPSSFPHTNRGVMNLKNVPQAAISSAVVLHGFACGCRFHLTGLLSQRAVRSMVIQPKPDLPFKKTRASTCKPEFVFGATVLSKVDLALINRMSMVYRWSAACCAE